jgi:dienelactone hydrolase
VYWLENRRVAAGDGPPEGASAAIEETVMEAATYVHTDAMTVTADGQRQPVTSAFHAALRREHTLAGMSLAMGPLPDSTRRCPLDMKIESESDRGSYIERRISFAAEPGDRVPALLLMPKSLQPQNPAMLCLHQTTGIGKGEPAGSGGLPNLHYAKELAEDGFICLAPDYPSFGDYQYDFAVKGTAAGYVSGSMKAIWNNLRAVDLLQSLPEVDPDRIGCIGHSLGGHNSLFTAAFDQRLRAVVTSCGFTGFHDYYGGKLAGWTSDRYMPRIREVYGNDPDRVPFDFQEVLGAIAPRAVFVSAPIQDGNFDNAGVKKVMAEAARVYAVYGAKESALQAEYPECGHDFPPEVRQRVREWLKEQLGLRK